MIPVFRPLKDRAVAKANDEKNIARVLGELLGFSGEAHDEAHRVIREIGRARGDRSQRNAAR